MSNMDKVKGCGNRLQMYIHMMIKCSQITMNNDYSINLIVKPWTMDNIWSNAMCWRVDGVWNIKCYDLGVDDDGSPTSVSEEASIILDVLEDELTK